MNDDDQRMESVANASLFGGVGRKPAPAAAWVGVLRSYGPIPQNQAMYDEYVTRAFGKAKVQPIKLATPKLGEMIQHIESHKPGSILIAGTAGDGKTYHCRALWEHIGGDPKVWRASGNVKEHRLADGRLAVFVKDLSEFNGEESDSPLLRLERSVLGGDDSEVVILAANHGQVLGRLRNLEERRGELHPLRKPLQACFLQAGPDPKRLAVFDLSRSSRSTLDEIISAVAGHPEWEKCEHCLSTADGKVCPIYENRCRLLGQNAGEPIKQRLGDLIEIARLNGMHLPVRDLLALCSNMILGYQDGKEVRDNLMTCANVTRIQRANHVAKASIYNNAFGVNLSKRKVENRPVFQAMSSFGAGDETTNVIDGLLVYGGDDPRLAGEFDKLLGSDQLYGASEDFREAQKEYLEGYEGARLKDGASTFLEMLASQRRRLYFTLPEGEDDYSRWDLTVFHYAGEYLEIIESLKAGKRIKPVTRGRITKGLNRVMTGWLLENVDKIFIASSGGFTQSRVSVLCEWEIPSNREMGSGMEIKLNRETERPVLELALTPDPENAVTFELTPTRYEFLCLVSEGALPVSFSNECFEDVQALKTQLLRRAEVIRKAAHANGDGATALTLKFMDVSSAGRGNTCSLTIGEQHE